MENKKVMFLIDGKDRTDEIHEIRYDQETDRMMVTYRNSTKVYPYGCDRVRVLDNPTVIELKGRAAFTGDMPVFEPQCILDFGEKIRIIGYNGTAQTVSHEEFHILGNDADDPGVEKILSYLREILRYTSKQPEETFLKREMDRLKYVHPDSVLSDYLRGKPVRVRKIASEDVIFPFHFNLSQKKALENALTSSISVIEGPPGTGKTQTILNIIANLITVQGKSVAVVSNNNEAVKNVAEKMGKSGYGFLLALLGKRENQDAFFANIPEAAVNGWNCDEEISELSEQIRRLNRKIDHLLKIDRKRAQLAQKLSAWKLEQEHFEVYFEGQETEDIGNFPLFSANTEKILSFLAETFLAKENQKDNTIFYKLKLLFKYRVFSPKKLKKHEISVFLKLQKIFYQKQIEELEKELAETEQKLKGAQFEELLEKHRQLSKKVFRRQIYLSHGGLNETKFTKKNYKVRFPEFIKVFPVILSTTYALRMSIPENYLLDYVIIDEASQVDLITGVLAFSCCRNVIIVGDRKQLPQITDISIKEKLSSAGLKPEYDYFYHSILSSVISIYGDEIPREILREHYRCHPQIIEFCNQKYYNGELIPYTSPDLSENPLCIYRTSEGNHMRKVTRGADKGIYNQRELDVIIREIIESPEYSEERENIGIVTPYRKQADKAGILVKGGVESDTVHKYQGREKDIMIMSTVLSGSGGGCNLKFVDDPHMVNVAVSRAIRQFILVTDHELFYKKGRHIGDLIRYIQYSTLDENVIESRIISVFDLLYHRYSEKLAHYKAKIRANARWKSEEVLRVLLEDILCEKEFDRFDYVQGVLLRNLLHDTVLLDEKEREFINNRASIDFVVFFKMDKSCALAVEVDGFEFHENNPEQLRRDRIKDSILNKYGIPFLRLPTNGSGEAEKIRKALMQRADQQGASA